MRKSLGLLLATLLLGTVLTLAPSTVTEAAPVAPAATVVQSQLIWTSGTMIANAYGTQVYELTVGWSFRLGGVGPVVAHPVLTYRWNARLMDQKVISGGFWACPTIPVPGGWNEFAPCIAYLTAVNQPSRIIDVYFHYYGGGSLRDLNIVDLKVDYLGNAAGMWVYDT